MTPEREKEIREYISQYGLLMHDMVNELLAEIDRLREENKQLVIAVKNAKDNRTLKDSHFATLKKLDLAVKVLEEIREEGLKGHRIGTANAHSFHLGMCAGIAYRVLEKIKGDK